MGCAYDKFLMVFKKFPKVPFNIKWKTARSRRLDGMLKEPFDNHVACIDDEGRKCILLVKDNKKIVFE